MRKTAVTALAVATLGGCAQHEVRDLTEWLKVDLGRPAGGDSGMIKLGQSKEAFSARVGSGWHALGSGHPSRYMVVAGGEAALIDLNDRKGVQLIRAGEASLRPVGEVFGRTGEGSILPGGTAIDFLDCRVPAKPAGCRDLEIARFDFAGNALGTFRVALPDTYPECQLLAVRAYDSAGIPYVGAQCARSSPQAKCLTLAPRKDGLLVHAVGRDRPWEECRRIPSAGLSHSEPESFVVLF